MFRIFLILESEFHALIISWSTGVVDIQVKGGTGCSQRIFWLYHLKMNPIIIIIIIIIIKANNECWKQYCFLYKCFPVYYIIALNHKNKTKQICTVLYFYQNMWKTFTENIGIFQHHYLLFYDGKTLGCLLNITPKSCVSLHWIIKTKQICTVLYFYKVHSF